MTFRPGAFTPPPWHALGLCTDPADFFAAPDDSHAPLRVRRARATCFRCPVREQCLEAGFDEEYGIWGGALPVERQAVSSLPRELAVQVLDRWFLVSATSGPFRVADEEEVAG